MADESAVSVGAEAIVAHLRRAYGQQIDELTYRNAVLAAAVEQLQARVAELEGGGDR